MYLIHSLWVAPPFTHVHFARRLEGLVIFHAGHGGTTYIALLAASDATLDCACSISQSLTSIPIADAALRICFRASWERSMPVSVTI